MHCEEFSGLEFASLGERLLLGALSFELPGFFSHYVWIMSGPGAARLFMFETHCCVSASVMLTGSSCGRLLCTALRFNSHLVSVFCDPSLSHTA